MKVVCKKNTGYGNFKVNHIYECNLKYAEYEIKINTKKNVYNNFSVQIISMIFNDKEFHEYFYTVQEARKIKLEKLC